jgi:hypothetical protein
MLHVSAALRPASVSALNDHVKPQLRLPTYPLIVPYVHTQRRTCKDTTRTERSHVNPEPGAPPYEAKAKADLC